MTSAPCGSGGRNRVVWEGQYREVMFTAGDSVANAKAQNCLEQWSSRATMMANALGQSLNRLAATTNASSNAFADALQLRTDGRSEMFSTIGSASIDCRFAHAYGAEGGFCCWMLGIWEQTHTHTLHSRPWILHVHDCVISNASRHTGRKISLVAVACSAYSTTMTASPPWLLL